MLRRSLQRLVRASPSGARALWRWVPGRLKALLGPLVHPIAAGRRGSGQILPVPATWRELRGDPDSEVRPGVPTVSVVIVTYENPALLESCLNAIGHFTAWPGIDVLVVDNGRNPETREVVARSRRVPMALVSCGRNLGFAPATNLGVNRTQGDIVVFLNDDTVVAPGWLARLVAHLQRDERLGVVCPATNDAGNEARVDAAYESLDAMLRFAEARGARHSGVLRRTEVVPLFCAALWRRVFDEVGGLDERYEVGMFEDDDLSVALRERGYHVGIADDAFVHHVGQASFSRIGDDAYLALWEANKRRYEEKWGRPWAPPKGSAR